MQQYQQGIVRPSCFNRAPRHEPIGVATRIGNLCQPLQRDNGNCPGTKGAGNCSGVAQSTWDFSHTFEPFSYLPRGA